MDYKLERSLEGVFTFTPLKGPTLSDFISWAKGVALQLDSEGIEPESPEYNLTAVEEILESQDIHLYESAKTQVAILGYSLRKSFLSLETKDVVEKALGSKDLTEWANLVRLNFFLFALETVTTQLEKLQIKSSIKEEEND